MIKRYYTKLRAWWQKFLPEASRDILLAENERLTQEAERLERELRELRAYVHGIDAGLRSIRKITINNHPERRKQK